MLYDNGGLPAPNRPPLPMPGYTPSANAMPTGIIAGVRPPEKIKESLYQPMQPNRPGVGVNPQMPMPGMYPGFPQQRRGRYRTLRNQLAMTNGIQPYQFQQQGNMQQPMGYYRPNQQPVYNNMASQFQYMMPQYQGNPYLPMVAK